MNERQYEEAVAFHGHRGPGIALGCRACEAALETFGLTWNETAAIAAISETNACPADAIQVLLGATVGKSRLVLYPSGKMAFSFYNRDTGESVRFSAIAHKKAGMNRLEYERYILEAPLEEIFSVGKTTLPCPERERVFDNVVCAVCGEEAPGECSYLDTDDTILCYECADATGKRLTLRKCIVSSAAE